ncbi:MAG: hypothetical protein ABIH89_09575 [Elusimicrobiota bacterium]
MDRNKKNIIPLIAGILFLLGMPLHARLGEINVAVNPESLGPARLIIKTLPLYGYSVYITFPDGGNMLIDTGSEKDSEKIVEFLKNEMQVTTSGKKIDIMKMFGWKPRIDWLVITNASVQRTGGFRKILENFEVKEIITAIGTLDNEVNSEFMQVLDSFLTSGCIQTNLVEDMEIDLKQTVSPLKLVTVGCEYFGKGTSLGIRLSFRNHSFLFLSELSKEIQIKLLADYGNMLKSTVLIGIDLEDYLKDHISPGFHVEPGKGNTIMSDGENIFVDKRIVAIAKMAQEPSIEQSDGEKAEINEAETEPRFNRAMGYFENGRHDEARDLIDRVKAQDPAYLEKMEEEYFKLARDNLKANEFKKTKEILDKIVFINPGNEEAKQILKRTEEALKMME